jgi:hypothetical protein
LSLWCLLFNPHRTHRTHLSNIGVQLRRGTKYYPHSSHEWWFQLDNLQWQCGFFKAITTNQQKYKYKYKSPYFIFLRQLFYNAHTWQNSWYQRWNLHIHHLQTIWTLLHPPHHHMQLINVIIINTTPYSCSTTED